MFLAKFDLAREEHISSPVLEAVRQATPESRAAFEAEYGPITPELHVIAGSYEGAWVDMYQLQEDGMVTKVHHEGDSEEAKRLLEEAKRQGPAF